jgi:peptide/nickel transport system substrate-binding protein
VARALAAAVVVALLAVSGAGGADVQTPKRGGTLVVRLVGPEPACLNVLLVRCAGGPNLGNVVQKVLDRVFAIGPDLNHHPRLVERVDFTRKRPFTLTYHIRPEARWSDGVPVTARDFVFTLRAIRTHGAPFDRALHAVIRSARALDAKTVRVVLRPRRASWPELFSHVLPSHALRGRDLSNVWLDRIDDQRTGRPIGSGPFLVESWARGGELVLRRNPRYWGRHPAYVDRLVLRFVLTATDPTTALLRGELDVAFGVPTDAVPAVRKLDGIRVSARAAATFEHLDLRVGAGAHPALRSKLVRRALGYGIDRVGLVRQVYGGVASSVAPLDNALLLPQDRGFEPNWRRYRYRPAEAHHLLAEAGCRRGADGIYVCAGARLALRVVTSAGFPQRIRALELVDAQLRRIGVDVEQVFVPPPVFIGQVLPTRAFDVALFSWTYVPGGSWKDVYGCGAPQNFTGYCQRLATADLDQADRILDPGQRARVLNRVDRRLAQDVPTIPLYQLLATSAHRAHVRNYALIPSNPLWDAENWWLDR